LEEERGVKAELEHGLKTCYVVVAEWKLVERKLFDFLLFVLVLGLCA
jgi:hypothetical protein